MAAWKVNEEGEGAREKMAPPAATMYCTLWKKMDLKDKGVGLDGVGIIDMYNIYPWK